jgi:hypothetical protein
MPLTNCNENRIKFIGISNISEKDREYLNLFFFHAELVWVLNERTI